MNTLSAVADRACLFSLTAQNHWNSLGILMILSGQGKQTCAVSGGGEGVHPTPRPRPFRPSMLAASTATAGTSVSGGIYGSGRTDGRSGGRPPGWLEQFYLQNIFISKKHSAHHWR